MTKPAKAISTTPVGFLVSSPVPLRVVKDRYLAWVLGLCEGHREKAAELAGVSYPTMRKFAGPKKKK